MNPRYPGFGQGRKACSVIETRSLAVHAPRHVSFLIPLGCLESSRHCMYFRGNNELDASFLAVRLGRPPRASSQPSQNLGRVGYEGQRGRRWVDQPSSVEEGRAAGETWVVIVQ